MLASNIEATACGAEKRLALSALALQAPQRGGWCGLTSARPAAHAVQRGIEIAPKQVASRLGTSCTGMAAEVVRIGPCERVDVRFRAPVHLLVAVEEGVRVDGETAVEGLPGSRLRDRRRKLIFVPAGHHYHEWHQTSAPSSAMHFYFDPEKLSLDDDSDIRDALRAPRLFFEDAAVWETVRKIWELIERSDAGDTLCFEALGIVLVHELVRPALRSRPAPLARGGLASWQQRILAEYIADHLSDQISLTDMARLVRLSPYHLCRAFKVSFGAPPHRYHIGRRIERAKELMANRDCSITEIALAGGFSDSSAFSVAFRRNAGTTPSAYRRSLR
ncbi:MAG: hypothetical protein JWN71_4939 [Xanthobacteraceae bacterium]|nr:hypothetical protein [Xanthobacteraceae bacterium]